MSIELYRIDDRLIHGQVVVGWGQPLDISFIVLVDDEVASSEWEQELYRMGTPPDMDVYFHSLADAPAALRACLHHLGKSPSRLVLVSMEDLWGETRPHNVPGTWREMPNWRRRSRLTLEAMPDATGLAETIESIARLRREKA